MPQFYFTLEWQRVSQFNVELELLLRACAVFHVLPPLLQQSVWLALHTFQMSKTFYNIPKSLCFPILISLFSPSCILSAALFSFSNPLWLTGPPICSGQHPDWQGGSRKWGCNWLVRHSAAAIRSFNTSRCLSSSRQAELWASITLLYTRRKKKKKLCSAFYSTAESSRVT